MKNCDTCANFRKVTIWNDKRKGWCSHTDYNIVNTKVGMCKDYRKAVNNKRKVPVDIEAEIKFCDPVPFGVLGKLYGYDE